MVKYILSDELTFAPLDLGCWFTVYAAPEDCCIVLQYSALDWPLYEAWSTTLDDKSSLGAGLTTQVLTDDLDLTRLVLQVTRQGQAVHAFLGVLIEDSIVGGLNGCIVEEPGDGGGGEAGDGTGEVGGAVLRGD